MSAYESMSKISEGRYAHLDRIFCRGGPFVNEGFTPGLVPQRFLLEECRILVIGAGGLGCEMLTNLAMLGFKDIHVIDMDTIDISNLNRQFLFRQKDVGKPKATVAAEFVMSRVPGAVITPYFGKIQDKDDDYYMQFNLIVSGLDSVEARRWLSATLVNLVDPENPQSLKPLIEGGTVGFQGNARVILPTITPCVECNLWMYPTQIAYPMCTIASTPRLPEHCIEWAKEVEWPRVRNGKKLDNDDPDHIQWLFDVAQKRAGEYNIEGVTWALTQGVIKNIVPAIASTNAIVAAICCNEAFKIATSTNPFLDNYVFYEGGGHDGNPIHTFTDTIEKTPECPVCGLEPVQLDLSKEVTLQDLVDILATKPNFLIKRPSISLGDRKLYFQAPPQLEEVTRPNLSKSMGYLVNSGDTLTVTAAGLPLSLLLVVQFPAV